MCIAETSFPEATSFTIGTTLDRQSYYNWRLFQKQFHSSEPRFRTGSYEYNQTYKYEDVADYVQKYSIDSYHSKILFAIILITSFF